MAIFHLSAHERVSRSAGQSSVASAAYIMRAQFTDERTGQVYDFRSLGAPQWIGMFSPKDAPDWTREAANAERFWNALELFEKRRDAQIALPLDIALPHELTQQQNIWLAQDYIHENFTRHGYVVLAAIHPPDHDERNIHLHLLVSLRKIDAHGFARTKTEQQDNYRNRDAYIENLREKWEHLANRHLERHGIDARIDRRTLQEQGIERAAQKHRGPTKSAVVFLQQDHETRAAAVAEIKQLQAQIIDLDAKRAERDTRAGGQQAREIPKAQDMAERTNDNDAYTGAEEYIDACETEFERQAEAAKGLPDPFRPPLPQNENERQALKLWLGELEEQMGGPVPIGPATEVIFTPAANQNQRDEALFAGSWDTLDPAQLPPLDEEPPAPRARSLDDPFEKRQGVPFTPGEPQPGRYDELKPEPLTVEAIARDPWNAIILDLPEKATPKLYAAVAETARDLLYTPEAEMPPMPFPAPADDLEWAELGERLKTRWQDAAHKGIEAERMAATPEPSAAPQWPYTIEEAIKRNPWNAVTLDLPVDASAELFNTIAGTAQDLRIDAQGRAAAATSIEETEYWHDLALKADRRFDDALAKFYEAAAREGIDLMKPAPEIAPEAHQTPEASVAPTGPEQTTSATDRTQRAAQDQLTADPVAIAPDVPARAVSRFLDSIADRLGGFITYLSDFFFPPPAMTPAQAETAAKVADERALAEAAEFEAYRQHHIPGYDPTDHQDSETRKTSERDHDRSREDDLEPD